MSRFDRVAPIYDRINGSLTSRDVRKLIRLLELDRADATYKILDIGGGTGLLAKRILHLRPGYAMEFTLLDPSPKMLARSAGSHGITAVRGQGEEIPFPDNTFNRVISTDTLHHTSDPGRVISEAYRVLLPDGIIVAREFNAELTAAKVILVLERVLFGRTKMITPEVLLEWGKSAGFAGEVTRGSMAQFYWKGRALKPAQAY